MELGLMATVFSPNYTVIAGVFLRKRNDPVQENMKTCFEKFQNSEISPTEKNFPYMITVRIILFLLFLL